MRGNGKMCGVRYGFFDASGNDFGFSIELDGVTIFGTGVYGETKNNDMSSPYRGGHSESSNYKEFQNLVTFLEDLYRKGLLNYCEVFFYW